MKRAHLYAALLGALTFACKEDPTDPDASLADAGSTDAASLDAGSGPDAEVDGGAAADVGAAVDAGSTADGAVDGGSMFDAGAVVDGGSIVDASGAVDAGSSVDGGSPFDGGASVDAGPTLADASTSTATPRFVGLGLDRKRTSCGIGGDRRLTCWGRVENDPPEGQFAWVDGGDGFVCAADTAGAVSCFVTSSGQSDPVDPTITDAPTSGVTRFACGREDCCAIRPGALSCWGFNLGAGPNGNFVAVGANDDVVCALDDGGQVHCTTASSGAWSVAPLSPVKALDRSARCFVFADGSLFCDGGGSSHPVNRTALGPYLDVASSDRHACAIRADGTLECWGDPADGATIPPAGTFVELEAGFADQAWTCARSSAGAIECWGANFYGQTTVP